MLGTVTYLALVVAAFGITSLLLDRDVVGEPDAGPLMGPAIVLAACAVTFVAMLRMPATGTPGLRMLSVVASAFLAMLATAAVVYSVTRGDLTWLVTITARYAFSPFVLVGALLAGASVYVVWLVTVRSGTRG